MKITLQQKEVAKGRIFDNIASAVSQTSQENWDLVVLRAKEILEAAEQLAVAEVEN